jgi:hypothetical protein
MSRLPFDSLPPLDPRWGYEDPSGLPEEVPVTLHLPERLLESVQRAAAESGVTPRHWVLDLIKRNTDPAHSAAA